MRKNNHSGTQNGKDVRNLLFISLMVKREARKKKKKHYSKIMVLKKECQQHIKERIQNKRNKKLGKKRVHPILLNRKIKFKLFESQFLFICLSYTTRIELCKLKLKCRSYNLTMNTAKYSHLPTMPKKKRFL